MGSNSNNPDKGDGGLVRRVNKKWPYSGYILKGESTIFTDRLEWDLSERDELDDEAFGLNSFASVGVIY